jgi:nucleotide-sensitive chloride channel 1A
VSNTSSSSDAPPRTILALGYPQIVMHAISRDPKPCIYLQLEDDNEGDFIGAADGAQALATEADEEEEEEEGEVNPEIRIVPSDPASVEEIFKALCECAALNPDPEEEGEGDFYFDEGEVMKGLDDETKAALLASRAEGMEIDAEEELEELVGDDPGRFEEDEEEVNGVAGSEK